MADPASSCGNTSSSDATNHHRYRLRAQEAELQLDFVAAEDGLRRSF